MSKKRATRRGKRRGRSRISPMARLDRDSPRCPPNQPEFLSSLRHARLHPDRNPGFKQRPSNARSARPANGREHRRRKSVAPRYRHWPRPRSASARLYTVAHGVDRRGHRSAPAATRQAYRTTSPARWRCRNILPGLAESAWGHSHRFTIAASTSAYPPTAAQEPTLLQVREGPVCVRTASTALSPPNANEFETATSMRIGRASFGT